MDFGEALKHLKEGKRIRREGWGGYWTVNLIGHQDAEDEDNTYSGYFIIAFLSDGVTITPAQPYQEDLLAEDWEVLEEIQKNK